MTNPSIPKLSIGCCMQMKNSQVLNFLKPILNSSAVSKVHLVRSSEFCPVKDSKIIHHEIDNSKSLIRVLSYYKKCRQLAKSGEVDAWISFYNIPYGQIVSYAVIGTDIEYHIGFVGTDWYKYCSREIFNFAFQRQFQHSSFITTTGKGMKEGLIQKGIPKGKISILPHSVDINLFTEKASDNFKF